MDVAVERAPDVAAVELVGVALLEVELQGAGAGGVVVVVVGVGIVLEFLVVVDRSGVVFWFVPVASFVELVDDEIGRCWSCQKGGSMLS